MSSSRRSMRMMQQRFLGKFLFLSAVGLLGVYSSYGLAAGFNTNFKPDASGYSSNNTGYCTYGGCQSDIGNSDPTPFGNTVVNVGGVYYFHILVGDPATGFAVESYTRAAGLNASNGIPDSGGPFSPDGGGNARSVIGTTAATDQTFLQNSLNMSNSLGNYLVSGTGSMNPSYTVFRMVLNDPAGGMSMDVSKPFLDKKPIISQTIQDGTLTSVFVADERAISYGDSSTAAPVVNNLVINDPNIPTPGAADFEMALAQVTDITAGRFTYTPGTGWGPNASNPTQDPTKGWDQANSSFGQGSYTYVDGQGFDPLTFNWASVFNYADNAIACSNTNKAANAVIRDNAGSYGGSCFNKP